MVWREYSSMSHGAFEGLLLVGMYYISDSMPHELGLATRIAPSLRSPIHYSVACGMAATCAD